MVSNGKRKKLRKVYYYADTFSNDTWEGIVFRWQDNSKIYWAGWDKDKQRTIIKKLIETHWVDKGTAIYQDYNQALLDISAEEVEWNFPRACLVLWREDFEWWTDRLDKIDK